MSDQAKLRCLYAKASSLLERWSAAHSRASALYASAASIHERLPLMDDDSRFGALAARDAALPGRARDAQADALDGVMTALAAELATFRALATALEKLRRDAETLAQRAAPAHAGAARLGPAPSVAELVAGLQDLWRAHRDESALKDALVAELTLDARAEDVAEAAAVFAAEPNLDPQATRAILDRVPPKALDER